MPGLTRGRVTHTYTRGGINFWGLGAFIKGGDVTGTIRVMSRDCPVTVTLSVTLSLLARRSLGSPLAGFALTRFHCFEGQDNTLDWRPCVVQLPGKRAQAHQ